VRCCASSQFNDLEAIAELEAIREEKDKLK